jgi:hypothetical protein
MSDVRPDSPFVALLTALEDGGVVRDADQQLAQLGRGIKAAQSSGKTKSRGTLTIVLSVTDEEGLTQVRAEVTHRVPKLQRYRQLVHVLPNGSISTTDPRQASLFEASEPTTLTVVPGRAS